MSGLAWFACLVAFVLVAYGHTGALIAAIVIGVVAYSFWCGMRWERRTVKRWLS